MFVELREGAESVSEKELVSYCRERMASFKIPKTFVFTELPKTVSQIPHAESCVRCFSM